MERNARRIGLRAALLLLALLLVALAITAIVLNHRDKALDAYRDDALRVLEERRGEYDEYTIVLSNTNATEAKRLAKKLNAELRMTSDGSFATLTLTDGRTIRDVYADDGNRKLLSAFSADYKAKISDVLSDAEHRYPTLPSVGNAGEASAALGYLILKLVGHHIEGKRSALLCDKR